MKTKIPKIILPVIINYMDITVYVLILIQTLLRNMDRSPGLSKAW